MSDAYLLSQEKARAANATLLEKLGSNDPGQVKQAVDAVQDFTRTKMREEGFIRRLLPPVPVNNDDLTRSPSTDDPMIVVDKEPDSPAAISVPFATLPTNIWIRGPRYVVAFSRILTPRFTKDVDQLRTWVMDIRQVMSDNAIKDMLYEEDSKSLGAVDTMLIGAGSVVPTSGVAQWLNMGGGIDRNSLADMLKIMPSTPSNLEVKTCLVNNITIKDVMKFGREEMGGDLAQDIMKDGWSLQKFLGVEWIVTIKKAIVQTNEIYMFADPKFLGKFYSLEDATMAIRREFYLLEFFSYETIGLTWAHSGGLAKATFV